MQENRVHQTT